MSEVELELPRVEYVARHQLLNGKYTSSLDTDFTTITVQAGLELHKDAKSEI